MLKNLSSFCTTEIVHLKTEPKEETRNYEVLNKITNELEKQSYVAQVLVGTVMCNLLAKDRSIVKEYVFSNANIKSAFPEAPTFGDILKIFFKNEEDLVSGKRLLQLQVYNAPRTQRTGDKEGIATSTTPIIVGVSIVEATEEDAAYIAHLNVCNAVPADIAA